MDFYLFHCPECHTIFKCKPFHTNDDMELYSTDYNDIILVLHSPDGRHLWECPKCNNVVNQNNTTCADWVAEKVFTVKGETSTSQPV